MDEHVRREYSVDMGIELTSLELIKENKYCLIYLVGTADGPRIVKKYKGTDTGLVKVEAEALSFYHELARNRPDLMDSGEPLLREKKNLLCMGFVEGNPLNETLYEARKNELVRKRSLRSMWILGSVIRDMYERTRSPKEETSPFIFEYFDYSSSRLANVPVLGAVMFSGILSDARALAKDFRQSKITPSFVHGDFVFKNIHVKDEKVGLIDFANANRLSHPLNDIYNLRFALDNMFLPKSFKFDLWGNFESGLGPLVFPEIAHRFYYEYHRRRWLMLKLTSKNPLDVAEGFRGLVTFAKSFAPEAPAT
jgi:hypothetical protein